MRRDAIRETWSSVFFLLAILHWHFRAKTPCKIGIVHSFSCSSQDVVLPTHTASGSSQGCSRRLDGEHTQLIASKLPGPEGRGGTGVAQLFPERTPLIIIQVYGHQGEEGL